LLTNQGFFFIYYFRTMGLPITSISCGEGGIRSQVTKSFVRPSLSLRAPKAKVFATPTQKVEKFNKFFLSSVFRIPPSQLATQKKNTAWAVFFFWSCGGDVRKFEPLKRLNIRNLDLIIRKLRLIYKEKPEYFEVPSFAVKVY